MFRMCYSLVLVVKSNLLTVRQLSQLRMTIIKIKIKINRLFQPHLSDLLESELIGGELIGEAGGPCCKLLGHVPHPIRKLKITKKMTMMLKSGRKSLTKLHTNNTSKTDVAP